MGSSKSVYFGPYLEVKCPMKKVDKSYKVNGVGKKFPLSDMYDKKTGTGLELVEMFEEELGYVPSPYEEYDDGNISKELWSDIDEEFFSRDYADTRKGYETMMVNNSGYCHDEGNFEVYNDRLKVIEEFSHKYEKSLKFYRDRSEDVRVCYGLIIYWS